MNITTLPVAMEAQAEADRRAYVERLRSLRGDAERLAEDLPARHDGPCPEQSRRLRHEMHEITSRLTPLFESVWSWVRVNGLEDSGFLWQCEGAAQALLKRGRSRLGEIDDACHTDDCEMSYWISRFAIDDVDLAIEYMHRLLEHRVELAG